MFFKKLFRKSELLLNSTIYLSGNSTLILSHRTSKVGDKELILLALLVYSRFLRVEAKEEREHLLSFFREFSSNLESVTDKKDLISKMDNLIGLLSKSHMFKDSTTIKLKTVENGNTYLDMGIINRVPLSLAVYTTFKFVLDNLEVPDNKIRLVRAFAVLSKIYEKEKFTIRSAVFFPNMVVYNTIPFYQPIEQ